MGRISRIAPENETYPLHCSRGNTVAGTADMNVEKTQSDRLEERLIEFAARIIRFVEVLPKTTSGRHMQIRKARSNLRRWLAWAGRETRHPIRRNALA